MRALAAAMPLAWLMLLVGSSAVARRESLVWTQEDGAAVAAAVEDYAARRPLPGGPGEVEHDRAGLPGPTAPRPGTLRAGTRRLPPAVQGPGSLKVMGVGQAVQIVGAGP